MCAVAPFHLPGLAAAPFLHARSTAATYAHEGAPAAADDTDALLRRDAHAAVRPHTPASGDDQPMSSAEFLGLSRQDYHNAADFDLDAILHGIRSIRVVPPPGFSPVHVAAAVVSTPTTPVASLSAPRSYGGDDEPFTTTVDKPKPSEKQGETYDAGIDATYRAMEKDPMEHPSTDYLETTQAGGKILMADRAELVAWMHTFAESYGLAAGALHRAVSYVDRYLSARKITGGDRQLRVLGGAAVFAAAKYEDRSTTDVLDADAVARHAGGECARRDVLDAERDLVAALGYRLSGPTAYTFVEHFTRNIGDDDGDGEATRCLGILPSAVAASAIIMAKLTLNPAAAWREDLAAMGFVLEDLAECMDAIKEMHGLGLQGVWPGCAQMMGDFVLS
nr:unnamed protein product [Digitaria exilis]